MNKQKAPTFYNQEYIRLFDRIGIWYDLLNKITSFGLDSFWRDYVSELLIDKGPLRLLDLACGTGEQFFSLLRKKVTISSIIGVDNSKYMLEIAQKKRNRRSLQNLIFLENADMHSLRFENNFFDAVTFSFGLNFATDPQKLFSEACRVLKNDSPLLILEYCKPKTNLLSFPFSVYFNHLIPIVGGLISGATEAYKKISSTTLNSPDFESTQRQLRYAGFHKVTQIKLFPGIVSIISAKKSTCLPPGS